MYVFDDILYEQKRIFLMRCKNYERCYQCPKFIDNRCTDPEHPKGRLLVSLEDVFDLDESLDDNTKKFLDKSNRTIIEKSAIKRINRKMQRIVPIPLWLKNL